MEGEGFFEAQARLKTRGRAAPSAGGAAPAPLTVTQLTLLIDKAIKSGVPASVTVRGQVSNSSTRQASGHLYFTLKDEGACIGCVMWREAAARLQFALQDGLEMIATGRVAVYPPHGKYQLQVQRLEPAGQGALELAFRQLQAKLAAEGLFSPARKKPIPPYPRRIALVTSKSTAAVQDMLKVLRRFGWLKLMLYHVPVQGQGAAEQIAEALINLDRRQEDVGGIDVILLGRGGGSLEDLWAFNEEIVARALAGSHIPIVTGIGHETDCTIADLVADYHAHTPTEAAQVVTQHWKNAADVLESCRQRANRGLRQIVQQAGQRLDAIERHEVFRRPLDRIQMLRQLLDDRQKSASLALAGRLGKARDRLASLEPRLGITARSALQIRASRLEALDKQLQALSPRAVLQRGYTITTMKKTGEILRAAAAVKPGDRLVTRFADGQTESTAVDTRQMSLFE